MVQRGDGSEDPAAQAAGQQVEHVAADGSVIQVVTRAEMRARTLRHRSVGVVVTDGAGNLLIHRRADWKDVFPGCWDLAFGGVCDVGEPYQVAAARELAEEAGVSAELVDLGPYSFDSPEVAVVGRLYGCVHQGPFEFDDGEVTGVEWLAIDGLADFVARNQVPTDSEALVTAASLTALWPSALQSANRVDHEGSTNMTVDLAAASVRPWGSGGVAARTEVGFVVLVSSDGADLVEFINVNQTSADLIELLVTEIPRRAPNGASMLFTASGRPYLLSWGQATTTIQTQTAGFTMAAAPDQVLVHPLPIEADDTSARAVLSLHATDSASSAAVIELRHGTMPADAVTIEFSAPATAVAAVPEELEAVPPLPEVSTPDELTPVAPRPQSEPLTPAPAPIASPPQPEQPVVAPIAPITPVTPVAAAGADSIAGFEVWPDSDLDDVADQVQIGDPDPVWSDDLNSELPPVEPLPGSAPAQPWTAPEGSTWIDAPGLSDPAPARPSADTQGPDGWDEPAQEPARPIQVPPAFEPAADPAPAAEPQPVVESGPPPSSQIGPTMVLGVTCEHGHHNHPKAAYCSQCGAKIASGSTKVMVNGPRPPLGLLVVDDGTTHSLAYDLIIGRDPASHPDIRSGSAGAIVLTDPSLALSRRHARIVLHEWSVYVTDLDSSNGTWLNRGANPQDWRRVSNTSTEAVLPGDRLRVGGRVLQVELHHIR